MREKLGKGLKQRCWIIGELDDGKVNDHRFWGLRLVTS